MLSEDLECSRMNVTFALGSVLEFLTSYGGSREIGLWQIGPLKLGRGSIVEMENIGF